MFMHLGSRLLVLCIWAIYHNGTLSNLVIVTSASPRSVRRSLFAAVESRPEVGSSSSNSEWSTRIS